MDEILEDMLFCDRELMFSAWVSICKTPLGVHYYLLYDGGNRLIPFRYYEKIRKRKEVLPSRKEYRLSEFGYLPTKDTV